MDSGRTPLEAQMLDIGRRARAAAATVRNAPPETRSAALTAIATALRARKGEILAANAKDVAKAKKDGMAEAMIDRLALDEKRLESVAKAVDETAALPDPVGAIMSAWERPNGLKIERVRTPIGVIGVIFESRPNVAADAGALCLRAGNTVILRGGSDSHNSVAAIGEALRDGLRAADLPEDAIQIVPTTDRAAVGMMLAGLGRRH